uniref:Uncharacterized protein n=1 Tax=Trypanosoma vivax (strain Y486) TaxID=1055687 RepID=G0U677_TRYVY|nr:conserved hypothetical protein [Trypanosoma vivax Y486]
MHCTMNTIHPQTATVELMCSEHIQRTILTCDEITAFQSIVARAIVSHCGKCGCVAERAPLPPLSFREGDASAKRLRRLFFPETGDDRNEEWVRDLDAKLRRKEEFMCNEGRLLRRIAAASQNIRQSGLSLYESDGKTR